MAVLVSANRGTGNGGAAKKSIDIGPKLPFIITVEGLTLREVLRGFIDSLSDSDNEGFCSFGDISAGRDSPENFSSYLVFGGKPCESAACSSSIAFCACQSRYFW